MFVNFLLIATGSLGFLQTALATKCRDNPNYRYQGDDFRDCDWIGETHRCNHHDDGEGIGEKYCPVTCDQCEHSVKSDLVSVGACYGFGEGIEVYFTNKYPKEDDWIGLYPSPVDSDDLGHPIMWFWLCGNQNKFCKVSYGSIVFGSDRPNESGTDSWPLAVGTSYTFILARRNSGGPYSSYAESNSFQVKVLGPGQTCDGDPEPSPSPAPHPWPTPSHQTIHVDPWNIPEDEKPYPARSAVVGDTITFTWTGNFHNVFLHSSLNCNEHWRIEVGTSSPASYTFQEEDGSPEGNVLFFSCDVGNHCERGMQLSVTVYSSSQPQTSPSPAPHPQPEPTRAPNPYCDDNVIYTNKECYKEGENIDVFFRQCSPEYEDWVGVYYSSANNENLGDDYKLWVWSCGNQSCRAKVEVGSITFGYGYPEEEGTDSWPLDASEKSYQVHLIRRDSEDNYVSFTESNAFRVVGPYEMGCTEPDPTDPVPTPVPTSTPYTHPEPSTCHNSLEVDMSCYVEGQNDITIALRNCDPDESDWIGIYDVDADPNQLGFPIHWKWACESQDCTIHFSNLDEGNYRSHWVRGFNRDDHYVAYESSDAFHVERKSCTPSSKGRRRLSHPQRRPQVKGI